MYKPKYLTLVWIVGYPLIIIFMLLALKDRTLDLTGLTTIQLCKHQTLYLWKKSSTTICKSESESAEKILTVSSA